MIKNDADKLQAFMNAIIDDVSVIGLSVDILEIHYKKHMDENAKKYFKNIKTHCDNVVKTINENNKIMKKNRLTSNSK